MKILPALFWSLETDARNVAYKTEQNINQYNNVLDDGEIQTKHYKPNRHIELLKREKSLISRHGIDENIYDNVFDRPNEILEANYLSR